MAPRSPAQNVSLRPDSSTQVSSVRPPWGLQTLAGTTQPAALQLDLGWPWVWNPEVILESVHSVFQRGLSPSANTFQMPAEAS